MDGIIQTTKTEKSSPHFFKKGVIVLALVFVLAWIIVMIFIIKRDGWKVWCGSEYVFNTYTIFTAIFATIGLIIFYTTPSIRSSVKGFLDLIPLKWKALVDSGVTNYFDPEYYVISKGTYVRQSNKNIPMDQYGLPKVDINIPLNSFNYEIYKKYAKSIINIFTEAKDEAIKQYTSDMELIQKDILNVNKKVADFYDLFKEYTRIEVIGSQCMIVKTWSRGYILIHKDNYIHFMRDLIKYTDWKSYYNKLFKDINNELGKASGLYWLLSSILLKNEKNENVRERKLQYNIIYNMHIYGPIFDEFVTLYNILRSQGNSPSDAIDDIIKLIYSFAWDEQNDLGFVYLDRLYIKFQMRKAFTYELSNVVKDVFSYIKEKSSKGPIDMWDFYNDNVFNNQRVSFKQVLNRMEPDRKILSQINGFLNNFHKNVNAYDRIVNIPDGQPMIISPNKDIKNIIHNSLKNDNNTINSTNYQTKAIKTLLPYIKNNLNTIVFKSVSIHNSNVEKQRTKINKLKYYLQNSISPPSVHKLSEELQMDPFIIAKTSANLAALNDSVNNPLEDDRVKLILNGDIKEGVKQQISNNRKSLAINNSFIRHGSKFITKQERKELEKNNNTIERETNKLEKQENIKEKLIENVFNLAKIDGKINTASNLEDEEKLLDEKEKIEAEVENLVAQSEQNTTVENRASDGEIDLIDLSIELPVIQPTNNNSSITSNTFSILDIAKAYFESNKDKYTEEALIDITEHFLNSNAINNFIKKIDITTQNKDEIADDFAKFIETTYSAIIEIAKKKNLQIINERDRLLAEISNIKEQVQSVKSNSEKDLILKNDAIIKSLNDQIIILKQTKNPDSDKIKELENQLSTKNSENKILIGQLNDTINSLRDQMTDLKNKGELALNVETVKLNGEISKLEEQIRVLKEKNKQQNIEITHLKDNNEAFIIREESNKATIDSLDTELNSLKNKLTTLNEVYNDFHNFIDSEEREELSKISNNDLINRNLIKDKIKISKIMVAKLYNELIVNLAKYEDIDQTFTNKANSILENISTMDNNELKQLIADKNNEINKLREQADVTKNLITKLSSEKDQLESSIAELNSKNIKSISDRELIKKLENERDLLKSRVMKLSKGEIKNKKLKELKEVYDDYLENIRSVENNLTDNDGTMKKKINLYQIKVAKLYKNITTNLKKYDDPVKVFRDKVDDIFKEIDIIEDDSKIEALIHSESSMIDRIIPRTNLFTRSAINNKKIVQPSPQILSPSSDITDRYDLSNPQFALDIPDTPRISGPQSTLAIADSSYVSGPPSNILAITDTPRISSLPFNGLAITDTSGLPNLSTQQKIRNLPVMPKSILKQLFKGSKDTPLLDEHSDFTESNQDESNQDESNQDESNQEESNQEELNKGRNLLFSKIKSSAKDGFRAAVKTASNTAHDLKHTFKSIPRKAWTDEEPEGEFFDASVNKYPQSSQYPQYPQSSQNYLVPYGNNYQNNELVIYP